MKYIDVLNTFHKSIYYNVTMIFIIFYILKQLLRENELVKYVLNVDRKQTSYTFDGQKYNTIFEKYTNRVRTVCSEDHFSNY